VMLTGRDDHSRYVAPQTVESGLTAGPAVTETSRFNYRDDDADDKLFKAPQRLQLLEERLNVTKTRERVGEVEVSKRVETHTEKVNVALDREEVVIERRAVTDGQAVSGAVLGSNETIKVELEAERANVSKQAFVVEEVEIGKRTQTETQVVTETIGKEVLEVGRNGQTVTDGTMNTTGTVKKDESLIDRAGDAVRNLADDVTGKNKR
ncbi:MAG: YsnF/AvaK domain-containing protein, partial [Pseudopedobacter sp.]|nr:YsnF/AvaK domain-containing protein [Deinococcales bacterium]